MLSANFGSYRLQTTAILTLAILLSQGNEVRGQIAPDNTVNTQVETNDNVYSITGGIESGKNLFHSFEQFSLLADEVANFDHGLEIENIFSRVTGGISEIDGLIQTQGNASLFLLNPAGVVFGGNAQLDIGGSFVVSTADSLIFENGTEFSAVAPEVESLLTISSPVGLQYGRSGAIAVLPNDNLDPASSGLSIDPGNTLALLGGDVSINQNSFNTVGSNIEIASIKTGKIGLQTDNFGWQFDYQDAESLGKINFSDNALISSSGRANLRAETIEFTAGSAIFDFNQFGEIENSINLTAAKSIEIDNSLLITQVGQRSDLIDEAITERGGDILIEAPKVSISNGSVISAATLSEGAGGSVTINAPDLVKLSAEEGNNPSFIISSTLESGLGGSIDINTGTLTIESGSQIQAFAGRDAMAKGGTITVDASQEITLSGKGILRSPNVDENGEINISEQEFLSGFSASSGEADDAIAQGQVRGKSGNLTINTPKLFIDRAAQISVNSYGLADAGNIKISASILSLDTAGEIVANTVLGEGGSIDILAHELIILDRFSSISTTAEGQSDGGNIILETTNLVLQDSNRVSANAVEGNGGNILIDTQGLFVDRSSSITASSQVETNQGNVEISTLDLSSRIATDYRDRSTLIVDDKITSGCGVGADSNSNQLRDIGRGGMPSNPLRETMHLETLNDWGEDSAIEKNNSDRKTANLQVQPIVEVSGWIINSQGQVELVAHSTQSSFTPDCQFDRSQAN